MRLLRVMSWQSKDLRFSGPFSVGVDRVVRQQQPSPLAFSNHLFHRFEQEAARDLGVSEIAGAFEIVPGYPD